jgi:hypothetical protein
MNHLGKYPFSGHGVILGNFNQPWQNIKAVLALFGRTSRPARRGYQAFVAKGVDQGRRTDLTGGGLIRSNDGWASVKAMRKANTHVKSDERILGDSDFVEEILSQADEALDLVEKKPTARSKSNGSWAAPWVVLWSSSNW